MSQCVEKMIFADRLSQDKPGEIIKDEIKKLQNVICYIDDNSRFGYHQQPQVYYV